MRRHAAIRGLGTAWAVAAALGMGCTGCGPDLVRRAPGAPAARPALPLPGAPAASPGVAPRPAGPEPDTVGLRAMLLDVLDSIPGDKT